MSDKPFFMYVSFAQIHVPEFASQSYCNNSRRGLVGDSIYEMDSAVGKIMETLKSYGLENDTITFFTSDNGPWMVKGI